MSTPLLFYSDWPLGYHNQEAERKARYLAALGYDVTYVAGVGTRNPRLRTLGKAVDRLGRALRPAAGKPPGGAGDDLRSSGLIVFPPRQLASVKRVNRALVERRLRRALGDVSQSVAWIRSPSPELVAALARLRPRLTVYEAVDAHHLGPGITGRWGEIFERAERELVAQAQLVIVTNESLAERFDAWGAAPHWVPHGVDLFDWRERRPSGAPVLGFLGVLDGRLDNAVLRHVAAARPDWQIRLVGPVERGFDRTGFDALPNISVLPPVAHTRIGEHLARFDVGLLAYAELPQYRHMAPLKTLELLAAGRGIVARPTAALERFGDLVHLATTPQGFVDAVQRVLDEDSSELALRRRATAEANRWDVRLRQLGDLLDDALSRTGS